MTGDLGSSFNTSFNSSIGCRRFDLSTPALIFGGLLLAATAARSLDATPAFSADLDEVKVLAEQPTLFTAGPQDIVMMGCRSEKADQTISLKSCKTNPELQ